jgi:hypothetical protein
MQSSGSLADYYHPLLNTIGRHVLQQQHQLTDIIFMGILIENMD